MNAPQQRGRIVAPSCYRPRPCAKCGAPVYLMFPAAENTDVFHTDCAWGDVIPGEVLEDAQMITVGGHRVVVQTGVNQP